MAQTSNNSAQSAADEKKSIGQRIKELLMMWIFRNSIAQRLDEIADQLDEAARQGDLMQEDINNLAKVVDTLAGKLRNTTPEQIKETEDEVLRILEQYTNDLLDKGKLVDGTTNEPNFFAAVQGMSAKYKDMTPEQFKEYFNKNAILYDTGNLKTKDGAIEGTTSLLIELDGECYCAEFNVSEPKETETDGEEKDGEKTGKKAREVVIAVSKFEGSYADAKEIKLKEEGAYETMMRSFLKPRELRRKQDIRKYDLKKLAKDNRAIRDYEIISEYRDKIVTSADGRYEITLDSKSNRACIRDTKTNDALLVTQENGGTQLNFANNVTSLDDIGTISCEKLGGWVYAGKGQIQSNLNFPSDKVAEIFNTKEFLHFLEMYGINSKTILNGINMKHDTKPVGFSKTEDVEALNRVDRLRTALDEVLDSKPAEDLVGITISDNRRKAWYDIKNKVFKDRAAVHLSIEDKQSGYCVSFHFDKNGEANCINYRKNPLDEEGNPKLDKRGKPIKPNYRFLQDFNTHQLGKDFPELKNDPEFMRVYELACEARDLYMSREAIIKKATKEEAKAKAPEKIENIPEEPAPSEPAPSEPKSNERKETKKGLFNRLKNRKSEKVEVQNEEQKKEAAQKEFAESISDNPSAMSNLESHELKLYAEVDSLPDNIDIGAKYREALFLVAYNFFEAPYEVRFRHELNDIYASDITHALLKTAGVIGKGMNGYNIIHLEALVKELKSEGMFERFEELFPERFAVLSPNEQYNSALLDLKTKLSKSNDAQDDYSIIYDIKRQHDFDTIERLKSEGVIKQDPKPFSPEYIDREALQNVLDNSIHKYDAPPIPDEYNAFNDMDDPKNYDTFDKD